MAVPENWPTHVDKAIRYLNQTYPSALEVLAKRTAPGVACKHPFDPNLYRRRGCNERGNIPAVSMHQLAAARRVLANRGERTVERRLSTKTLWPREVVFRVGQLVQVYRSDGVTPTTHSWQYGNWNRNDRPPRVISRTKNSYKLETLEGLPIGGHPSRRLRRFIPRDGTCLREAQRAVEEALGLAEEKWRWRGRLKTLACERGVW